MAVRLPQDEAALVHMAAECSHEAVTALVDRVRRRIRLIVGRYAADRDDRDDLEQDVVGKLLADSKRALRVWEPRAPFAAYITTITARHCVQWSERQQRLRGRQVRALPSPFEGERREEPLDRVSADPATVDPPAVAERSALGEAVRDALRTLSAPDRVVLALYFEDGEDGPAIARTLGISHNAARQRIFKAVRRLGRALAERHPDLFGES